MKSFLKIWGIYFLGLLMLLGAGFCLSYFSGDKFLSRSEKFTYAATFTVNSTGDGSDNDQGNGVCDDGAGNCTLRAAIEEALASAGNDLIQFNLVGGGPYTITPGASFPSISGSDGLTIDGFSQTGAAANTNETGAINATMQIEIDGSSINDIFVITGDNVVIRGLVVNRAIRYGININNGDNNRIEGCYIGTDTDGLVDLGNGNDGIYLQGNTGSGTGINNVIGTNGDGNNDAAERNIISGNNDMGVETYQVNNLRVAGNIIGAGKDLTTAIGNTRDGIRFFSSTNNFAGTNGDNNGDTLEGNIVVNNSDNGIEVPNGSGNTVAGNYVGILPDGTVAANTEDGVEVGGTLQIIGTDGDGVSDANERNYISGNTIDGISTNALSSSIIAGNYIGVDPAGLLNKGNTQKGIQFYNSPNNRVGTNGDGTSDLLERNIISGNGHSGIRFVSPSHNNVVAGNYIGVGVDGRTAIGNSDDGIDIQAGDGQRIGSNDDSSNDDMEANLIAFNVNDGVKVNSGTTGHRISRNVIYANGDLGIDLNDNGFTANDAGDGDSGANNLLNFPVVTGVTSSTISGTLDVATPSDDLVQVFQEVGGEGYVFLGTGTPDGSGNWTVSGSGFGGSVVAITIDESNNTSEFSSSFASPITVGGTAIVNDAGDAGDSNAGDGNCFTATSVCTLRAALEEVNSLSGAQNIHFKIPGLGTHTITPLTDLPALSDNSGVTIDGYTQPGSSENTNEVGALNAVLSIEIDGANDSSNGVLRGTSSNNTIKGLVINNSANYGIAFTSSASGNKVQGCFIGTNIAGDTAVTNTDDGVLFNFSANSFIGTDGDGNNDASERNLISGNTDNGVHIAGSSGTNVSVAGNIIGLNKSATAAIPNAKDGVFVGFQGSTVRIGTNGDNVSDNIERNIISGNTDDGIANASTSTGNSHTVAGNYIGLNADGTVAIPNGGDGIDFRMTTHTIGVNGDNSAGEANEGNVIAGNTGRGIFADFTNSRIAGNIIGLNAQGNAALANGGDGLFFDFDADNNIIGTNGDGVSDALERNIISGNGSQGIAFNGNAAAARISGNYIGTDITGLVDLGNASHGIELDSTQPEGFANFILGTDLNGTSDAVEGNIISGNAGYGLFIDRGFNDLGTPSGWTISGNKIGVGLDGITAIGNDDHGIYMEDDVSNMLIGSSNNSPEGVNIIANNGGDGIFIIDADTSGVRILHNSIFNNAGLGIDLGTNGVTSNDLGDSDTGANNLVNFPLITSATTGAISGTLDIDTSPAGATVHIYTADNEGTNHGEGQTFVGSATPDGGGNWTLNNITLINVSEVTATATDSNNNTSEFGTNLNVAGNNPPNVAGSLASAAAGNKSSENLIISTSPTDVDGNSVMETVSWRVGGASIAKGLWSFNTFVNDLTAGEIIDYSGNSNDGQLGGGVGGSAPVWKHSTNDSSVIAGVGGAFLFDGTDDYIALSVANLPSVNASKTIELWYRRDASDTTSSLFSMGAGASAIYVTSTGAIHKFDDTSIAAASPAVGTGAWTHLVYTFDGTTHRVYVNGTETGTSVNPGDSGAVSIASIGQKHAGTPFNFKGHIGEVIVYDRVLTPEQITSVYNSGTPNYKTLVNQEIFPGQSWTAVVTPSDGNVDGTALTTNAVVINTGPFAPTSLQTEGEENPDNLTILAPTFSAQYNDNDSGDIATKYRLQIDDTDNTFASLHLDTGAGGTLLDTACNEGERCEVVYSGPSLSFDTTYFWRILFHDDSDDIGAFSSEGTFKIIQPETTTGSGVSADEKQIEFPKQPVLVSSEGQSDQEILWVIEDNSKNEQVHRLKTSLGEVLLDIAADRTEFREKDLSPNTYYERRVVAFNTRGESPVSNLLGGWTLAAVPEGVSVTFIDRDRIDVKVKDLDEFLGGVTKVTPQLELEEDQTAYYFLAHPVHKEEEETEEIPLDLTSDWVKETSFSFSELKEGVEYEISVKKRNAQGLETEYSEVLAVSTLGEDAPELDFDLSFNLYNGSSLVELSNELDYHTVAPGNTVEYVVEYKNKSDFELKNLVIANTLSFDGYVKESMKLVTTNEKDGENEFELTDELDSDIGSFAKKAFESVVLELPSIQAKEEGIFTYKYQISERAPSLGELVNAVGVTVDGLPYLIQKELSIPISKPEDNFNASVLSDIYKMKTEIIPLLQEREIRTIVSVLGKIKENALDEVVIENKLKVSEEEEFISLQDLLDDQNDELNEESEEENTENEEGEEENLEGISEELVDKTTNVIQEETISEEAEAIATRCPEEIKQPVCGEDNITYQNTCFAEKAGTTVLYQGQCLPDEPTEEDEVLEGENNSEKNTTAPTVKPCPTFTYKVCGNDGVTYLNSCFLEKAGQTINYYGECKVLIPEQEEGEFFEGPEFEAKTDEIEISGEVELLEEGLLIKGKTSPDSEITVFINKYVSYKVVSNSTGNWNLEVLFRDIGRLPEGEPYVIEASVKELVPSEGIIPSPSKRFVISKFIPDENLEINFLPGKKKETVIPEEKQILEPVIGEETSKEVWGNYKKAKGIVERMIDALEKNNFTKTIKIPSLLKVGLQGLNWLAIN